MNDAKNNNKKKGTVRKQSLFLLIKQSAYTLELEVNLQLEWEADVNFVL